MQRARGLAGHWKYRLGGMIDWGYRLLTSLIWRNFPDNIDPIIPMPPVPEKPRVYTRRCLENHDRPGVDPLQRYAYNAPPPEPQLHSQFAASLQWYLRFVGLVQYVSEVTGVERTLVVQLDEESRIGRIHDQIKDDHGVIFRELETCVERIRNASDGDTDPLWDQFDEIQSSHMEMLAGFDFGASLTPEIRSALKTVHGVCLNLLEDCLSKAEPMSDQWDKLQLHVGDVKELNCRDMFNQAQKGYQMCYYEIEEELEED